LSAINERAGGSSRSALALLAGLTACLTTVAPPAKTSYNNPLDFQDGGRTLLDSGLDTQDSGGATFSQGMVDGRNIDLSGAIYQVTGLDGGQPRTEIALGDFAGLCAFVNGDSGSGASYDLVRMRLAGDIPGTYDVASALSPSGATAALQYQSDAGGFGTAQATAGEIELESIDPGNQQLSQGVYTLTFRATESLSVRFLAAPCAGLSPPGSGD
jgi:hypothetical protein